MTPSQEVVAALTASGRGVERPGESRGQDPLVVHGGAGQSGGFRTTDLDNNGSYIVGSFPWPQEVADPLTTNEGTTFRTRNVVSAPIGFSVKDYGADAQENIAPTLRAMNHTVRRLTPRECERLQGFPDDYTIVPWRGKPADQCPDGPRYKALGNSMAVPVMRWIGRRIDAHTSPGSLGKTHD